MVLQIYNYLTKFERRWGYLAKVNANTNEKIFDSKREER